MGVAGVVPALERYLCGGGGFQSLFWWRGRLDGETINQVLTSYEVSILVLVERPFGRLGRLVAPHRREVSILVLVERPFGHDATAYSFQSLFWWRGRLDACVWTVKRSTRFLPPMRFQSLFWWRGRLDVSVGST